MFTPLVFISSTNSVSLVPIDLTYHVAIFSVSNILDRLSVFAPGHFSLAPSLSEAVYLCLRVFLFYLGGLPAHLQNPHTWEDQFVSLSLASLLRSAAWEALPGT
jgi:hypothetical protein